MKQRILGRVRIREVSVVDKPAQEGAIALILKSDVDHLQKCIMAAMQGGDLIYKSKNPYPGYTNRDFEQALETMVKQKRLPGEQKEQCYARLLREDEDAVALTVASLNATPALPPEKPRFG